MKINYQSIGSGGGIAQIKAGTVDFGASDKPLPPDELAQAGLAQFPVVIGGVVPVVNIEGVGPGRKRALLHAFGSARGVSRASVDDLAKVEGVSEPLAERIFAFFHKA